MFIQVKKNQYVRKAVVEKGEKFYEAYNRTKVMVFGIPVYTKWTFLSRERALKL